MSPDDVRSPEVLRPQDVIGLVLAGGRSSRMGEDKAFLAFDGTPLLIHQIDLFRSAGIEEVLVSLRRDMTWHRPDVTVILDEVEDLGPLGGIAAAMAHVPDRPLLVLAVDMPQVDKSFLRELITTATPEVGIVPRVGTIWEPLCGLYPPGTAEAAARHLSTSRSPSALADELLEDGRIRAHTVSPQRASTLRSWNRPEDLQAGP